MVRLAAYGSLLLLSAAALPMGTIELEITGLRSARGLIHVCITQDRRYFPDCRSDPRAIRRSAPADTRQLRFAGIAPGRYAMTLAHDENANQRLDTMVGIPREGFGFSRNPKIRFGAPKFEEVSMEVGPAITRTSIRAQYLL